MAPKEFIKRCVAANPTTIQDEANVDIDEHGNHFIDVVCQFIVDPNNCPLELKNYFKRSDGTIHQSDLRKFYNFLANINNFCDYNYIPEFFTNCDFAVVFKNINGISVMHAIDAYGKTRSKYVELVKISD